MRIILSESDIKSLFLHKVILMDGVEIVVKDVNYDKLRNIADECRLNELTKKQVDNTIRVNK